MAKNIRKVVREEGYPNADAIMERGGLLPLHHGMTEEMFNRLHENINEFIECRELKS
jgi:CDP-6-deoxy-D-xylo-4-hexulose-3-dehydrase